MQRWAPPRMLPAPDVAWCGCSAAAVHVQARMPVSVAMQRRARHEGGGTAMWPPRTSAPATTVLPVVSDDIPPPACPHADVSWLIDDVHIPQFVPEFPVNAMEADELLIATQHGGCEIPTVSAGLYSCCKTVVGNSTWRATCRPVTYLLACIAGKSHAHECTAIHVNLSHGPARNITVVFSST